jgi:hypothetical protein
MANKSKLKGSYKSGGSGEFMKHADVEKADPNTVTKVAAPRRLNVKQAATEFFQGRPDLTDGYDKEDTQHVLVMLEAFGEFLLKKKK